MDVVQKSHDQTEDGLRRVRLGSNGCSFLLERWHSGPPRLRQSGTLVAGGVPPVLCRTHAAARIWLQPGSILKAENRLRIRYAILLNPCVQLFKCIKIIT